MNEELAPVPIPLRRKYLEVTHGRHRGGYAGNNNPAKPKYKLSEREIALHKAQPVKMMVMNARGQLRMITVTPA